ncbi:MmgE/PrpD family protein [uncultured Mailhella sp.]|uniref:MmgE/PrpD family protein n=1 Tax=uncultured Mailhella sp. TaxID=1981031 RepID=UPI0025CE9530|nr:MmgE/PrpD family protein [uncultured Mailhella sp.]
MSQTKELAAYGAALRYEDIPAEVLNRAKNLTLQTLGVSLAALSSDVGRRAVALGKVMGQGGSEATIWGDGSKVNAAAAGLANGTLADALDWEDCSWTGHPSACAVSTGLAMGEQLGSSGKDYLLGLVTAYELYERIAMAVQPGPNFGWMTKGWGLTSWVIYASSIMGGKLLGLDKEQMENLIGITGALTPTINVLTHVTRTDYYHFQWGMNSMNGIAGAHLAKVGISSLPDYLDGDSGYWCTMTDDCKWEWYTKNLGSQWMIMETLMKHWPTNMWIQQPLDGMAELIAEHGLKPADIASITISPEVESRWHVHPDGYPSVVDGQFSIPYCVSAMLHHPAPTQEWYSEAFRHDPSVVELSTRIHCEGEYMTLQQCFETFQRGSYPFYVLKVDTVDGRHLVKEVPLPKGHPRNMMTDEEFIDRFHLAAGPVIGEEKASRVVDMVRHMEELDKVADLVRAMNVNG